MALTLADTELLSDHFVLMRQTVHLKTPKRGSGCFCMKQRACIKLEAVRQSLCCPGICAAHQEAAFRRLKFSRRRPRASRPMDD